jgi:hypothetical protein
MLYKNLPLLLRFLRFFFLFLLFLLNYRLLRLFGFIHKYRCTLPTSHVYYIKNSIQLNKNF